MFVDTNTPSSGIYRDTGSTWVQIADPGAGTTGTLQQVTTNGNTTTNDINLNYPAQLLINNVGSKLKLYYDNASSYSGSTTFGVVGNYTTSGGLRFEVNNNIDTFILNSDYTAIFIGVVTAPNLKLSTLTPGSVLFSGPGGLISQDNANLFWDDTNNFLGIGPTGGPTALLDIHSGTQNIFIQVNATSTNNSQIAFLNGGAGKWRIGNLYNSGANDYIIYDTVNSLSRLTVKNTGQTFIGTDTTSSGALVVNNATSDNHIVCIGANAPSVRIRNTGTSPTLNVGFGISTATNNFIQGSASGNYCIFNSSTTASPILFGIYNAGASQTQEVARISAAQNFLIGTTTDTFKLNVNGTTNISGALTLGSTISNGTYTYTLPSATGTLAIVSQLSGYLPLSGGTVTGFTTINIGAAGGNTFAVDKNGGGNVALYASGVYSGQLDCNAAGNVNISGRSLYPSITIKANGTFNIANTQIYATNALALAGGLVAGDIYKSATGVLSIVY